MRDVRSAVRLTVAVLLGAFALSAQGAPTVERVDDESLAVRNWTAPPFWLPARLVSRATSDPDYSSRAGGGVTDGRSSEALAPTALPSGALPFFAIAPCRLADTRAGFGFSGPFGPPALGGGSGRDIPVTTFCGIPSTAQAVSFNVTVTNTLGPGFILAYPTGGTVPNVSTINYVAGQTLANAAIIPLGTDGKASFVAGVSGTDLVLDVNGYYAPQSAVTSLNGATGTVTLVAGQNVSITNAPDSVTIATSVPEGPPGPQGTAGPTGPSGPAGAQGPIGPQGATGATGNPGTSGLNGKTVLNGVADPTTEGVNGDFFVNTATSTMFGPRASGTWPSGVPLVGPQGLQGPKGDIGLQGIKGDTGSTGPQGLQGGVGPQGLAGETGSAGPAGIQGLPGNTGPQGPAGLTWRGAWVSSTTYDINDAVSHLGATYISIEAGNLNSEPGVATQWSLLAAKGDAGPAGAAGPQGPAGAAGPQGLQGLTGPTGATGPMGPAGPPGESGAPPGSFVLSPPDDTTLIGAGYAEVAPYRLDFWTKTADSGAPSARRSHTAVWTGSRMIIWGGYDGSTPLNDGGQYDPVGNVWTPIASGAPTPRYDHTAVWTGSRMIIWGGYNGSSYLGDGGQFDPVGNAWAVTSTAAAPSGRASHTSVWTGSKMIVWGGYDGTTFRSDGARYDPVANSWAATTATNAPSARRFHTAVWSGSRMIVWGGDPGGTSLGDGRQYDPAGNVWTAISLSSAPLRRSNHTAVWTGSRMIIWGGLNSSVGTQYLAGGGQYDPVGDAWTWVSAAGEPSARYQHTAVWTGSRMIIWGGYNGSSYLGDGGQFDPVGNAWAMTSTAYPPGGRSLHTSIWTGSKMIVWGGNSFLAGGGQWQPLSFYMKN